MTRRTMKTIIAALTVMTLGSSASASIVTPSQFHATILGFTTYADADFMLPDATGVTIGNVVFATLTPTTLQVGLPQQGFANFSQSFTWDLTGLQLSVGQVISGLTLIDDLRTCCSTSTSFTADSIHVGFNGTDTRSTSDTVTYQINFTPADVPVPEPVSLVLVTSGLVLLGLMRRRR